MNEHNLSTAVLAIIAALALAGIFVVGRTGSTVYEQPAANKPVFLQTSVYRENFNLCQQYICNYPPIPGEFYGEYEPAQEIGTDANTGNLRCGCPDGREFLVRPDLILEASY